MKSTAPGHRDLIDRLLLEHGTVFMGSLGAFLFLVGYLGLHWINRRKFYRRKMADPFPSYFRYRLIRSAEGWLGLLFMCSSWIGILCMIGGLIDWIDG